MKVRRRTPPANTQTTEPTTPASCPPSGDSATHDASGNAPVSASQTADPGDKKPPPDLPLFFMLSHVEDDGPVRLDGVKLGVCEVMGQEIDEPKLGRSPARSTPATSRSSFSSGSTRRDWTG